jgi:hypothetical protein
MTDDLINCLRQDAEMLKDGHQKNLTKLWCDVAALDVIRAARRIEALEEALWEIKNCLGYVKNEGKPVAVREANSHLAWKIARTALDGALDKEC